MRNIKHIEVELLISSICKTLYLSHDKLKSYDRHGKLVYARQLYAYMSKSIKNKTCEEIGKYINRSHSNIVRARRKIKNEIKLYSDVKNDIDNIRYYMLKIDFIVYDVDLLALCVKPT